MNCMKREPKKREPKKLVILALIPVLLSTVLTTLPFSLADTGRFDELTVLYRVETQADVDALPSDIDAFGYDIAILVEGSGLTISGLEIHDATKFGIAVDGQHDVIVTDCEVYNIGHHTVDSEFDPNGGQYGLAIYYYASSGTVSSNKVWNYQKNGITANFPSDDGGSVYVLDNTVTGLGPVDFIAQNGIQFGWEAKGLIRGNTVSGNYYLNNEVPGGGKAIGKKDWVSCGILLYLIKPGAKGVKVSKNKIHDNQVPIYIYPS